MSRRKSIIVLMGGRSPEHEISVIGGKEVVKNLNSKKYDIFPVIISKDGERWQLTSAASLEKTPDLLGYRETGKDVKLQQMQVFSSIKSIPVKPDVVFIAMHGTYGEDGTVQGLLNLSDLKYTGSGVLASAIGMDKLMFKRIMVGEKIGVPRYVQISKDESITMIRKKLGAPPYFIKPSNQGSSIGCSIVKDRKNLKKGLEEAWRYSKYALVEEYIKGTELTCAVLGNDKPYALPVIEIIPKKGDYFDYDSKYTESGSDEIVPATISKELTCKVMDTAIKVHKILGCRGFSRVDFIIKKNKTPLVLEVNTIPGLTPMSLLPKAARSFGITYPRLLDKIIEYALE